MINRQERSKQERPRARGLGKRVLGKRGLRKRGLGQRSLGKRSLGKRGLGKIIIKKPFDRGMIKNPVPDWNNNEFLWERNDKESRAGLE